MPNPGQVNNGSGANGYTGPGGTETPYGAVKRLTQQTQAAPIGPVPGMNAPQRAKRAAQGSPQEPPPATPGQSVMAEPSVPLPVAYAQAWSAVAADPGASPLVRQMAEEAQRGV